MTVAETVSAAGRVFSPLIIYGGTAQYLGWHKTLSAEEKDYVFSYSPKGWIDDKLALMWLEKILSTKQQHWLADYYGYLILMAMVPILSFNSCNFVLTTAFSFNAYHHIVPISSNPWTWACLLPITTTMAVKWMTIRDLVTTRKPKELRSTCLFEWLQMQERRLLPHLIFVKLLKELGFGLCLRKRC